MLLLAIQTKHTTYLKKVKKQIYVHRIYTGNGYWNLVRKYKCINVYIMETISSLLTIPVVPKVKHNV